MGQASEIPKAVGSYDRFPENGVSTCRKDPKRGP